MSGISRVHEFLQAAKVPYTVVPHRPAFTAQEEAAAAHVPGRDWAKVVVCLVDGQPIEALLPAPFLVDLEQLRELAGGKEIRLAQEEELRELFPGCESVRFHPSASWSASRCSPTSGWRPNPKSSSEQARTPTPF